MIFFTDELMNNKKEFEQSKCELERYKKNNSEQTGIIMELEVFYSPRIRFLKNFHVIYCSILFTEKIK